jgi:hypothetical protein
MLGTLFPIAYAAIATALLVQSFRMMRIGAGPTGSSMGRQSNRTGLRTVHPELLNEHGEITTEELWAVSFSELKGAASPES